NQYIREVREGSRRHINIWLDLRRDLRTRFVPASYARDLVEEYFKEMGVALMRANYVKQLELSHNQGGTRPRRDPNPTILTIRKLRKRESDPEKTRV
ncbi:hypothetical protein CR513_27470, partial [Mucuna pruriens]